jgi:hypothetical protein
MISTVTVRGEERIELTYHYGKTNFRLSAISDDGSIKLIGTAPASDHGELDERQRTISFISSLIEKAVEEKHPLANELKKESLRYIAYPTTDGIIRTGQDCGLMNY